MFDQLGDKGTRKGDTENGDLFELTRRAKGKFKFRLMLGSEPDMPYGQSKVNPYDTDISDIMAKFTDIKETPA